MMLSLVALGPIYSFVYTEIGIHPDGFLARGTAQDPGIPKDVAGAKWYEVPGIWWNTVEGLPWEWWVNQQLIDVKFDQFI